MFGHYLTSTFKNLRRAPFATSMNVLTLGMGLACYLFAYAIVNYYEMGDRGFANASRIHVLTQRVATQGGRDTGFLPLSNEFAAKYLRTDFPQLEKVARATYSSRFTDTALVSGQHKGFVTMTGVDPEFLEIFDLPFAAGDSKTALGKPKSIVLSEMTADKLFGRRDVLGERIMISGVTEGTVTGLVKAIAQPSHMGDSGISIVSSEMFVSYDMIEDLQRASMPAGFSGEIPENWFRNGAATYILLPGDDSLSAERLAAQLAAFAERHIPPTTSQGERVQFGLSPLSRVTSQWLEAEFLRSHASLAGLLLSLGGLVLLVAGLNYANLATAQATVQAKSVGIRKVLGASRAQIMIQYLFESALLVIAALLLAIAVLEIVFSVLKTNAGIDLGLSLFTGFEFWLLFFGLMFLVTLLAGSYPALVLSGVRPVMALSTGRSRQGPRFVPTVLVGIQFAVASLLLIGVLVMSAQNSALSRIALESGTDPVVTIMTRLDDAKLNLETLRAALAADHNVAGVTALNRAPWKLGVNSWVVTRTDSHSASQHAILGNAVAPDFFKTMQMKLVAGRFFDAAHGDDESPFFFSARDPVRAFNVILDRSAVTQLGFVTPAAAVGQLLYSPRSDGPSRPLRVIGVVEDRSLYLMGLGATANIYTQSSGPSDSPHALLRISARGMAATLANIDAVWARLSPDVPIKRRFADELFNESYELFGNVYRIMSALAFVAFLIAATGLLGMAIHVAGRRRHEIGVRKSVGASTQEIFLLLLRDFSKPVIIANLLAWPIGFLAMNVYLNFFSQRIPVTPAPFILSFLLTLLVAWVAVGGQAWRAARAQPATVLRHE